MFWEHLLLLSILCAVGFLEGWSLQDFGVSFRVSPIVSFAMGVACYGVFIKALNWFARLLGVQNSLSDASFEAIRLTCPRDRNQKRLLLWSACLLNPITEEVLFRGVLIHGLAEQGAGTAIAIGIGLSLSLLVHIHHGALAIPGQLLFHGLAVVLLLSPLGLLGCIGFHFAGDLYPTLTTRQMMNEWVARRRNRIKPTPHSGPESRQQTAASKLY